MSKETFKVTECLRVIQNLFAKPKYTKLSITMEAWIKLMCYIHLVGDNEITGLGRIKDETIVDFKIPKQIVDGVTANANDDDMLDLLREIPIEEIEEWELDWHSHVDMEAFISATDEANYELMSMAKGNKQFPLLVVNKRGEICFKNFIHEGKTPNIELTLLKKELSDKEMEGIYEECKADVQAKVSKKKPKIINPPKHNWGSKYFAKSKFKKEEDIKDAEYEIMDNSKYYCRYCGTELITPDEIDEGLCEQCMIYETRKYGYGW